MTRSEFPKSNNLHTVLHLVKAVTSKPKKIENRGWSHFEGLEISFLTVILLLILKSFPREAIANRIYALQSKKAFFSNFITMLPSPVRPSTPILEARNGWSQLAEEKKSFPVLTYFW